jgi:hypothetical protein
MGQLLRICPNNGCCIRVEPGYGGVNNRFFIIIKAACLRCNYWHEKWLFADVFKLYLTL